MIFSQRNFKGGENLQIYPEYLRENQVLRALNMNLTDGGQLETRFGKDKINTTSFGASPILGVWRYVKEDGSKFLVVHHNTSLYAAAWTDLNAPIASWSTVQTGLTTDKLTGLVWKNLLILSNGSNAPFYFNGVSCANLGGSPPNFKVFTIYAGRIWCVDAANGSWIRFSGLEDMNSWDALDVINVRDQDGDRIRGLQPIEGGLGILKDTSVWPLYGSSRADLRLGLTPIDDTVGCYGNEASLPQGVFFSGENIYQFGLSAVSAVADSHTPIFKSLTETEKRACFFGVQPNIKRGILYIPAKDTAVVLDGRNQGITTWEGLNANCFAVADGVGDDHRLILGDATAGNIYMLTGSTDEGAAIGWKVKLPYNDHATTRDKIWRMFKADVVLRQSSGEIMDGAGGYIGDGYGGTISGGNSVPYSLTLGYDLDYKNQTGTQTFQGVANNKSAWESDDWESAYWGFQAEPDTLEYWIHGVRGESCSFEISGQERALIKEVRTQFSPIGRDK